MATRVNMMINAYAHITARPRGQIAPMAIAAAAAVVACPEGMLAYSGDQLSGL